MSSVKTIASEEKKQFSKCLVVDDSRISIQNILGMLNPVCNEIVAASSTEEALKLHAQQKKDGSFFDFGLVDIEMKATPSSIPSIDVGLELIEKLRKLDSGLAIIAYSGLELPQFDDDMTWRLVRAKSGLVFTRTNTLDHQRFISIISLAKYGYLTLDPRASESLVRIHSKHASGQYFSAWEIKILKLRAKGTKFEKMAEEVDVPLPTLKLDFKEIRSKAIQCKLVEADVSEIGSDEAEKILLPLEKVIGPANMATKRPHYIRRNT